jgi:hypothetical protein
MKKKTMMATKAIIILSDPLGSEISWNKVKPIHAMKAIMIRKTGNEIATL